MISLPDINICPERPGHTATCQQTHVHNPDERTQRRKEVHVEHLLNLQEGSNYSEFVVAVSPHETTLKITTFVKGVW